MPSWQQAPGLQDSHLDDKRAAVCCLNGACSGRSAANTCAVSEHFLIVCKQLGRRQQVRAGTARSCQAAETHKEPHGIDFIVPAHEVASALCQYGSVFAFNLLKGPVK